MKETTVDVPEGAEDIGGGTYIVKTYKGDDYVGIVEFHEHHGRISGGSVPFDVPQNADRAGDKWQVESYDPLTLSPSIACHTCPHHGYIRNGKWESC